MRDLLSIDKDLPGIWFQEAHQVFQGHRFSHSRNPMITQVCPRLTRNDTSFNTSYFVRKTCRRFGIQVFSAALRPTSVDVNPACCSSSLIVYRIQDAFRLGVVFRRVHIQNNKPHRYQIVSRLRSSSTLSAGVSPTGHSSPLRRSPSAVFQRASLRQQAHSSSQSFSGYERNSMGVLSRTTSTSRKPFAAPQEWHVAETIKLRLLPSNDCAFRGSP